MFNLKDFNIFYSNDKYINVDKHRKFREYGTTKKKRDKEHEKKLKEIAKKSKRRNRK